MSKQNKNPRYNKYPMKKDQRHPKKWDKEKVPAEGTSADNDIGWYMKDKSLIDRAGKVSFANPLGGELPVATIEPGLDGAIHSAADTHNTLLTGYRVPGITRIVMSPSLGVSKDANSPLNIMARNLFSTIQSTLNMKLAPAIEAPDLVCYLGAVDSIDSFFSWVSRLYGTIANENLLNRYYGRALAKANGVDYDDLRVHASDIYFWLLRFRERVNRTLVLPKEFGFVKRHYWLFGNYFKDAPVEKSQLYVHAPCGFYQWSPTEYETGTALHFKPLIVEGATWDSLTWSNIQTYGEELLNAMLTDQDANSIGGFILRGWGTEGCVALPEVPINYMVAPIYSEEILGQIHNSQAWGCRLDNDIITGELVETQLDYYQKQSGDSWLYCYPGLRVAGHWSDASKAEGVKAGAYIIWADASYSVGIENVIGLSFSHLMDSFNEVPTEDEVIINSRNMMTGHLEISVDADHSVTPYKTARLDSCGLDIIWFYQVIYYANDGTLARSEFASFSNTMSFSSPWGLKLGGATIATELSKFDWAPRCILGNIDTSPTYDALGQVQLRLGYDVWDYNNVAHVSNSALDKMHLAALDGAFDLGIRVNGYDKIAGK